LLDEWDESEAPLTDRFVGFATIGERYLRGRSCGQVHDLCERFGIPYVRCRGEIGMVTRKGRELLVEAMHIDGDPSLDGPAVLWGHVNRSRSPKLDWVTHLYAPWRFADAGRLHLGGIRAKDVRLLCDAYGIAYTPRGQHDGEFAVAELQALIAAVIDDGGQCARVPLVTRASIPLRGEEDRRRADAARKARERRNSTGAPDDKKPRFVAPSRAAIPTSQEGRAMVIDRLLQDFLGFYPEDPSAKPAFYRRFLATPTRLTGIRQIRFSHLLDRHAPLRLQYSIYVELTEPRERGAGSRLSDSAKDFLRSAASGMRHEILASSGGSSKEAVSEGLLLHYGIQLSPSGVRNQMLCCDSCTEPSPHRSTASASLSTHAGGSSSFRTRE